MVVIEVLEHMSDSMNGKKYERYKLKAAIGDNITTTTGFAAAGVIIQKGDIVEHMQVIGKATAAKMCKLHYAEQQHQEQQKALLPRKKTIPIHKYQKKKEQQAENVQLSLF